MNPDLIARYALGYLIQVLPCGLLLLYCFAESLRFPFWKTACAVGTVPLLCAALFVAVAARMEYDYAAVQATFYLSTLIYAAMFLLLVKGRFLQLASAYVTVFCYAVQVSTLELALSHALRLQSKGELLYYWHDILLFAVVTALTLPLFARIIRNLLPLLSATADRPILAASCAILGCYTLAVSVCVVAAAPVLERALFLLVAFTGLAGSVFVCLFMYLLLKRLKMYRDMADRMTVIESQVALQKAQYQHMADHMEQARKMRHDLRHHIAVLNSLAADGNLSGVKRYLSEYALSIPPGQDDPLCRNYIVDMIARHYLSLARQEGVECTARLALPPQLPIADLDLCIVLGNCLENALEACRRAPEGERFIRLAGKVEGAAVAITLDNSFDGRLPDADGVFRSDKPMGGVGLQNVRAVAEKYGGQTIFNGQGNVFSSSVVLFFPDDTAG